MWRQRGHDRNGETEGVNWHRLALISRSGGSQLSVLASWGPWLPPLPRTLRGDWAEQRKVETSDLVKLSELGHLLLPPVKALDQGNSLKKVFGSRALGGWPSSRDANGRFPGLPTMRKHLLPQEQCCPVIQMAFHLH